MLSGVILVLSWCYPGVLSWRYPGVILVLSWRFPGVILVLSGVIFCYRGCARSVTNMHR